MIGACHASEPNKEPFTALLCIFCALNESTRNCPFAQKLFGMVGAQAAASAGAQSSSAAGAAAGGAAGAAAAGGGGGNLGAVAVAGYDSNTDDYGADGDGSDDSDDGSGHDLEGEDERGESAGIDGGAGSREERDLARAIALSRAEWEVSGVVGRMGATTL